MAQATRPRPRPRLVSRQAATSDEATTAVDEDDLFRRSRGRTAQHWKQLEQSAAKATPFTGSDDGWDINDVEYESFSKIRKKKKPIKQDRPRWQETDVKRMLTTSDHEDNEVQIIEHTIAARNPCDNTSPNKRKRGRSRSKSLTPPPALPAHQRANAMYLVRQALAVDVQPRPPSPSPAFYLDDPNDTMELDPELAEIAQTVRQQMKHAHTNPQRTGGPENVNIKVRWRPHPRGPLAQEQLWSFNIKRHDTFRELFDDVADLAGVMANQLVVSHNDRPVFASGTPNSLRMWAEGDLEACDKQTAEYIRSLRNNPVLSPPPQDSTQRPPSTAPPSEADSETESTGDDTIKLILRSAATKDKTFPLTVRSTTTCGAIVKAFLKTAGLPDNHSRAGKGGAPFPQLVVDGDKMDSETEIGDADLEDGDLVEIVGV